MGAGLRVDSAWRRGGTHRSWAIVSFFFALASLLTPLTTSAQTWSAPRTVYVPTTGHTTDGLFLDLWRSGGGSLSYGNPITAGFTGGEWQIVQDGADLRLLVASPGPSFDGSATVAAMVMVVSLQRLHRIVRSSGCGCMRDSPHLRHEPAGNPSSGSKPCCIANSPAPARLVAPILVYMCSM